MYKHVCAVFVFKASTPVIRHYKYVPKCTKMYKYVQICANMCKYVQVCTNVYKYVQICMCSVCIPGLYSCDKALQICSNMYVQCLWPSARTAPTGTHEVSQILSRRLNTWQKIHRTTLEGGWYRFVNSVSYTHDSFVFFLWGEDRHMKRGSTRQTRGATEHKRGATEEKRGATTQELQQHKRELQQDKREITWAAERTSGRYHSMKWVSNTHSSSNHLEPPNPPKTIILSPTMEAVWQLRPFGANFETTRYQKKGPFVESLSRLTCVCDWVWAFYVKEFNVHEGMRHFMWMKSPSHYRGVPAYMNACGHFLWMNSLYLNACSNMNAYSHFLGCGGWIRCIWMNAAFYP